MDVEYKGKDTIIHNLKDFDLGQTMECGQCFHFQKIDDDEYGMSAYGKFLHAAQKDDKLYLFDTTKEEFEKEIASSDNISDEERNKIIESGNYAPSYMWNVNGWLCDKLGLTVTSQRQKCVPTFNSYDIESETLGITVKEGMATGMSAIVTTETKEGITLETECIGKVYNKDEFDKNEWTIYGDCDTTLVINKPNTVELTCASIVNRIPDVINAPAGFVPTSRMGELKYIKKES